MPKQRTGKVQMVDCVATPLAEWGSPDTCVALQKGIDEVRGGHALEQLYFIVYSSISATHIPYNGENRNTVYSYLEC